MRVPPHTKAPHGLRRALLIAVAGVGGLVTWPARARADGEVPVNWPELAVERIFTLRAPPGTRFVSRTGVDSRVGTIVGPGFTLELDYGAYSDRFDDLTPYDQVSASAIDIGGKVGRLVRGRHKKPAGGNDYFIGLYVPAVAPGTPGPLSLTLTATVRRRASADLLVRMFGTIYFRIGA